MHDAVARCIRYRPAKCRDPVDAESGSHLRLTDACITQLKAQRPSRTFNKSREAQPCTRTPGRSKEIRSATSRRHALDSANSVHPALLHTWHPTVAPERILCGSALYTVGIMPCRSVSYRDTTTSAESRECCYGFHPPHCVYRTREPRRVHTANYNGISETAHEWKIHRTLLRLVEGKLSSGKISVEDTWAQQKSLHVCVILVIVKEHLVQIWYGRWN